jgi:hypothetical protein
LADDFTLYVKQFEESEQAVASARAEAEKARDYFDGRQFSSDEEAALRKRKQPITPENLIKPKIEGLCGLERQSRTDPQAYPRTQQHDEDASAATDGLRYVSDDQDLDIKFSRVFENMLVEGFGAVEVGVAKVKDQVDPKVTRIAHDRLYHDPYSAEHDFSDASFLGYVTWMDAAKAKLRYKGKEAVIDATINRGTSSSFDTFDDKPRYASWYDSKRGRIRINTHYHMKDGVWHRCVFTLSGELEESKPVEFIDDEGKPECPLIMQSAYVDRDNDRYGIVRDMIPLQDEVNKRRSKFLHMVNNAKVRVSRSMGQDKESVRKEMSKPDGVIVADPDEVQELGNFNREAGQFQLLQDSRQTLKGNIGPNATMQGKQGDGQSGRAILALQQAGMTEMTPLLDNLRHFKLRVFRQLWNRIRQYWTAERWIRVTDDEKNVRFVGLNVTQAHLAMQKVAEAMKKGEIDEQMARQFAMEIQSRPDLQQPANAVAELDVDILIDEVNETPTLQAEQFEQLVQLASTGVMQIPPELIIRASNLRDKQKLLDVLEEQKQGQQQPNPMQEIAMAGEQAKVEETQSKAALNMAKAQTESVKPMEMGLKAAHHGAPPSLAA